MDVWSRPHPCVVDAVTLTTMMVALVRICCKFSLFLHLSRLFPSSYRTQHTRWNFEQTGNTS